MTPSKVRQHLDEHLKHRIAWKRQENMTYKWIFAILKIEMLKTSLSAVKRIGKMFVIEGTFNRKIGYGGSIASTSTIKHDNRLKITVFKGIRKHLLSTTKVQNNKKKYFF